MSAAPLDIHRILAGILAEPEFQPDWQDRVGVWLRRALEVLARWLNGLTPAARWGIVLVGLGVLAGFAYTLFLDYGQVAAPRGRRLSPAAAEDPQVDLFAVARELASGGRLREAARALQQAVYRGLAQRQALDWVPARADWEWVAVLGGEAGGGETLAAFTADAQALAYGPVAASPEAPQGAFGDVWERGLWARARALVDGAP